MNSRRLPLAERKWVGTINPNGLNNPSPACRPSVGATPPGSADLMPTREPYIDSTGANHKRDS